MSTDPSRPLSDREILDRLAGLVETYYKDLIARGIDLDLVHLLVQDFSNVRLMAFYSLLIGPTGRIDVKRSPQ